jgi:hypothetical protein
MSPLEKEIVEKFYQLDAERQQRVLRVLNEQTRKFDWRKWFANAEALYEEMSDQGGELPPVNVVSLAREVREDED